MRICETCLLNAGAGILKGSSSPCRLVSNFPMILMAFKLPPALLAGNTVVLKPAPTTPLTTLKLAGLMKDIVPRRRRQCHHRCQ